MVDADMKFPAMLAKSMPTWIIEELSVREANSAFAN
jgi:hypothetical protein